MQRAPREASRPAKITQQCAYAAWGPLGSGSLSTLGLVTGTISGSHMCIVYNIFNFKSLAAVFIFRWHTATWITEVRSAAEWPTLDLVLQASLVQACPSSHRRSDPLSQDRRPGPLRKASSSTVPSHWPPFTCLLLPPRITVIWHPKNADLPNRGCRNVIAETTGISLKAPACCPPCTCSASAFWALWEAETQPSDASCWERQRSSQKRHFSPTSRELKCLQVSLLL